MKNTNSIFYSGIGHLFNKKLRYKPPRNKCSTLVAKNSLETIEKYRLEKSLATGKIDYKDKSECRIMIVDDKKANVVLLEHILSSAEYKNILTITDSREVTKNLKSFKPDLLLLDLVMPDVNGIDILNHINNTKAPFDYLPVIILSAANGGSILETAFEAGANDFLAKPFKKHELLLRVNNLLQNRLLNEALQQYNNLLKNLSDISSEGVSRALDKVTQNQEETLWMMGLMLEYRDYETKGHTARVSKLALSLAKELGFRGADLENLRWGAYLHDIGKIAVSDTILLKPAKLTMDEYEKIKEHVLIGEKILNELSFIPQAVIEIVKHHHERWDGMGYPYGLAKEEIPVLARIFAVVDVYDALITARPYKKAWTIAEAKQELFRQKHKQFDPEIVDAFLAMGFESNLEEKERLSA